MTTATQASTKELSFFSMDVESSNADQAYADAFAEDSEEDEDPLQRFLGNANKDAKREVELGTINFGLVGDDYDDTVDLTQKVVYVAAPRVHVTWYMLYLGLALILGGAALMIGIAIHVHHTVMEAALWTIPMWLWAPYNLLSLWARTPQKVEVRRDRLRIVGWWPFKYDFKFESFEGTVYTFDVHPEWRDTFLAMLPAMYEVGWNFGTARTRFVKIIRGGWCSDLLFNVKDPDQLFFNLKITFDAHQEGQGTGKRLERREEEHLVVLPTDAGT